MPVEPRLDNFENPLLPDGRVSPQTIYEAGPSRRHPIGSRGVLADGSVWYYARNSAAAALAPGKLAMAEVIHTSLDDLAVDAAAIGATQIAITPIAGVTADAGDFDHGYIIVNTGAHLGARYQIRVSPAIVDSPKFTVTLEHPLIVALDNTSRVFLIKNPWMDVVIAAGAFAHMPAGVPTVAVPAGNATKQYAWLQTWGLCSILDDENAGAGFTTGEAFVSGPTDGAVEAQDAAGEPQHGINLFDSVDGDYGPKWLQIAP